MENPGHSKARVFVRESANLREFTLIGAEATSRNRYHFQAFAEIKALLGDKPLVLDREFSYLELMQALVMEEVNLPYHKFRQIIRQAAQTFASILPPVPTYV